MTAWMDAKGTLHIASENVYESLALKGWLAQNEIQNVNGVNMIPSRHMLLITAAEPQTRPEPNAASSTTEGKR